jgi:transposase
MLSMDYFASTSLSKLKKMIDAEKDATIKPTIKQKLLVVWHKKKGETEKGIEEILLVPKSTVGYLFRRFRKKGIKGFERKRKPGSGGHNRYLTKEQEQELKDMLASRPMATKEVLVHIKKNYGKRYHPNYVPKLLRRLGQSLITPRKRHYKANPLSGWAFKGHIKKAEAVEG